MKPSLKIARVFFEGPMERGTGFLLDVPEQPGFDHLFP
jgi:hypothetical protein